MTADEERAAGLVIRAWREAGAAPEDVRARLTKTLATDAAGWEERAVAGEREILDAVAAWLRAFRER